MKKLLFFLCTVCFAVACNNKDGNSSSSGSDSTKMSSTKLDYPYKIDSAYKDWQPGDQQHAVNVMKSLKAWQDNNIAECVSYMGDSLDIQFDNYRKKLPHDNLTHEFTNFRNAYTKVDIKMEDWESVISKDGKDEWVTMWYKQITTDLKGKIDSVEVINDAKMLKGKIIVLDEYIRHLPAKK